MNKGWMLFDAESGNAIDMTLDPKIAKIWEEAMLEDENIVVIAFNDEGFDLDEEDNTGE